MNTKDMNAREGDGVAEAAERLRVAVYAAAKRLRVGVPGPLCADELEAAYAAMQAQQGAEPVAFPLYEFTNLLMCSDPWPVDDAGYGTGQDALVALADRESQRQGFTDWIDAIHQLKAPATGAPR